MKLSFSRCKCDLVTGGLLAAMVISLAGCAANSYALRQQGKAAMADGNYAQAAEHFNASLKQSPTNVESLYLLGQADLKLNQPLDAQLALEKAVALSSPDSARMPGMLNDLAEAMARQHQDTQLRNFLQEQVNKRGTVGDYLRQGKYLARIGDMDKAKLAYRQAAYFAPPGDVKPYELLAKFYESINDIDDAKKAWRYAYYVKPGDPRIADALRRYNIVPGPTAKLKPPKPGMVIEH